MCSSPIWSPSIEDLVSSAREDNVPYFNEGLLSQQGEEVQCIPFTTSPFSLLDRVKNATCEDITVDSIPNCSHLSLDVKYVRSKSHHSFVVIQLFSVSKFSASPLLIPIYLGLYECQMEDGQSTTVTAWIPANEGATVRLNLLTTSSCVLKFSEGQHFY